MQKFAIIAVLSAVLLTGTVYAETVTEDYGTGEIIISGTAEPDSFVGLQVMKKDKDIEDFYAAPEGGNVVLYNNQTVSDSSGEYNFIFKMSGKTGTYNAYISAMGMTAPKLIEIPFVSLEEYAEFIDSLNEAANEDLFFDIMEKEHHLFGDDTESLISGISYKDAMKGFYEFVKKNPLTLNESGKNSKIYNSYVIMQAAKSGSVNIIGSYAESVYISDDIFEWVNHIKQNTDAMNYFDGIFSTLGADDIDEFQSAFTEAAVLAVVRYPGGYENAKKIIEQYSSFLGVTPASNEVYKKIAGKAYSSKAALKEALNNEKNGSGAQISGGGSSGGGSGGSKTNTTPITSGVYPSNVPAAGNLDKIKVSFEDIDSVQWANEAITALCDKNIIAGKEANRFYPNDFITREEFVKIIAVALELDINNGDTVFEDVPADSWYAPYVNAAFANGIINGKSKAVFGSGENITRQDIAVIIHNASRIPDTAVEKTFTDIDEISDYAAEAVKTLTGAGIINGNENNEFMPQKYATRAEAAKMVYQALKYFK